MLSIQNDKLLSQPWNQDQLLVFLYEYLKDYSYNLKVELWSEVFVSMPLFIILFLIDGSSR